MSLTSLIAPATKLIGKFVKDKTKQMELAHEISTMAEKHSQELALAQIKLNTEEAKGNWFQSSWRPLGGWVCAIAFGWHFVFQPLLIFILSYAGQEIPDLPDFDMSSLLTVLGGLLGLGSVRSFEKYKGVSK